MSVLPLAFYGSCYRNYTRLFQQERESLCLRYQRKRLLQMLLSHQATVRHAPLIANEDSLASKLRVAEHSAGMDSDMEADPECDENGGGLAGDTRAQLLIRPLGLSVAEIEE